MIFRSPYSVSVLFFVLCLTRFATSSATGQSPPVINVLFPAGGKAGQAVVVTASGSNLQGLQKLHSNIPGFQCERLDGGRFRLTIPEGVMPGLYDLWGQSDNGLSAPRTFAISNRTEHQETEPNDSASAAISIPIDAVINGRIDKVSDVDFFQFSARQGHRVVVECWAERIDSRLRAVLEVFDLAGRRLAVNRGYFGIDPLIDFRVPADGGYIIKVQDLISAGSAEHYYRLDIDTGPRVAFSLPNVVERGQTSRVVLFGWNLSKSGNLAAGTAKHTDDNAVHFDQIEVEIPAALARESWPLPVKLLPPQAVLAGASFPYFLRGSHAPVPIGVTDVPVVADHRDNHSPSSAQRIDVPCEVSGQLATADERDWFTIQARRGEVFQLEAFGQRIQSPVDLQVRVLDAAGERELARFSDEVRNSSGPFPTAHLDPAGRWVCPADGRYLLTISSLIGGSKTDLRRTYRLSIHREEPDFELIALPRRDNLSALNIPRGGREAIDLLALRRRGLQGAIRVFAKDLPAGIECPDVWLGPGVDRATVIVSAQRDAAPFGELKLDGVAADVPELDGKSSPIVTADIIPKVAAPSAADIRRPVLGGTIVRTGTPNGWGRITSQMPLAVAGDSPLRITADAHEMLDHHLYGKLQVRHSPGSFLDVAVHVEWQDAGRQEAVRCIGVGLPELVQNQTTKIPPGQQKGYVSFYLPPALPVGRYSLVIHGETSLLAQGKKPETVVVYSNPVTFDVHPAAFLVEVDPFTEKRVKRGDVIKVTYSSKRLNGFIGKMHTELAVPGRVTEVSGFLGRGETFVGQSETGALQIIINGDAPLGRQSDLRLLTVGVLEEKPVFFGSSSLPLEVVE
ncbi:hypothetical protein ETAA8_22600 [Anatilimnocola aggregata]|uniref:Peptidase C-terminal archaeal/bacterial domain-containing protein n=1 Tax=Anatilimnocola aggregata TaxID=2528021 RepID=A0A517YAB9_9BACT|nr:PPC domain-containing protein [Anatilimnocola aggregata]QDU27175.1 hypothetical protein ETAA8_22600 [Anatilimnocola aggregata]